MDACSTGPRDEPGREPLLLAVVGPTASGKTALSLTIAEKFCGEIVNCDSVAIYREFEIGTAKPSLEQRQRVPHHLIDICAPNETMTAGEYARRAREVLAAIRCRKHLPVVAGGTGFYLRALLEGLFAGPERSEELRARLRQISARKGPGHLHRMLRRFDSGAAEKIHPNDEPKIIRALEVCLVARQPISTLWQQGREPLRGFRILRIGLDPERNALYARINERARRMFDLGLIDETERLMREYPNSPLLNALGYKQAAQVLRGETDRHAAMWAATQGHRNYAKRQLTWFRREPGIIWLKGFGDDAAVQREALAIVERNLLLD